jgi:hypothetical protein
MPVTGGATKDKGGASGGRFAMEISTTKTASNEKRNYANVALLQRWSFCGPLVADRPPPTAFLLQALIPLGAGREPSG